MRGSSWLFNVNDRPWLTGIFFGRDDIVPCTEKVRLGVSGLNCVAFWVRQWKSSIKSRPWRLFVCLVIISNYRRGSWPRKSQPWPILTVARAKDGSDAGFDAGMPRMASRSMSDPNFIEMNRNSASQGWSQHRTSGVLKQWKFVNM
jgi:hypothetical protein